MWLFGGGLYLDLFTAVYCCCAVVSEVDKTVLDHSRAVGLLFRSICCQKPVHFAPASYMLALGAYMCVYYIYTIGAPADKNAGPRVA